MAVAYLGIGTITESGQTITIPENANYLLYIAQTYNAKPSTTVGGNSLTEIIYIYAGDGAAVIFAGLANPPTGTQTVTTTTTGYYSKFIYLSGVDGVADSEYVTGGGDITGLTAPSGSMMFGIGGSYYGTQTVTDNSQTELWNVASRGAGAYKADANAFYWTVTGGSTYVAVAAVLNPAASAVALPRRALDGPFYGSLRGSVR